MVEHKYLQYDKYELFTIPTVQRFTSSFYLQNTKQLKIKITEISPCQFNFLADLFL